MKVLRQATVRAEAGLPRGRQGGSSDVGDMLAEVHAQSGCYGRDFPPRAEVV